MTSKLKSRLWKSGIFASGAISAMALATSQALAQTTTPGLPTTGVGGEGILNILLLIGSVALVAVGISMLRKGKDSNASS